MKHLSKLILGTTLFSMLSMSAFAAKPIDCPTAAQYKTGASLLDTPYQFDEDNMVVFSSGALSIKKNKWQLAVLAPVTEDDVAIQDARAAAQRAEGPAERDEYQNYFTGEHYVTCSYHDQASEDPETATLYAFLDLSDYNAANVKHSMKSNKVVLKSALQKMMLSHKKK